MANSLSAPASATNSASSSPQPSPPASPEKVTLITSAKSSDDKKIDPTTDTIQMLAQKALWTLADEREASGKSPWRRF